MIKNYIYISYSKKDDAFVNILRHKLEKQRIKTSGDAREIKPGAKLDKKIENEISQARAFIVLISPESQDSEQVRQETSLALQIQAAKETPIDFPVIPLVMGGADLNAFTREINKDIVALWVPLPPGPGDEAIREVMPRILEGLEKRLPTDIQAMVKPPVEPVDELVLKLTAPRLVKVNDKQSARATARLIYYPADEISGSIESENEFSFTAPVEAITQDDIRWYLEKSYLWPSEVIREKAGKIESKFPQWGKSLFNRVFQAPAAGDKATEILKSWRHAYGQTARRFTVLLEKEPTKDKNASPVRSRNTAAARLLSLPWELLYDGDGYIFQGAQPVTVRRCVPSRQEKKVERALTRHPIRVLIISPRPGEKKAGTGYFDHRISALPLIEALETIGNLVDIRVLVPPTLPALEKELQEADQAGKPYHIIHFDGHAISSTPSGMGGVFFESPAEVKKLEKRKGVVVDAKKLADVINKNHIPLLFLAIGPSAQPGNESTAAVAADVTAHGVATVVAMNSSILLNTTARFVAAFYSEIITGARVGSAFAAAQRHLFGDRVRMKVFGTGKLELHDWFVPRLFQVSDDVRFVAKISKAELEKIERTDRSNQLSSCPPAPQHGFVGRCQELLQLERLLEIQPYGVIFGQSGEGKTALATEFGRWVVRSQRFDQAVYISFQDMYDVRSVIDRLGSSLLANYTVSKYNNQDLLTKALLPIEKELRTQKVLLIFDSIDSVLPSKQTSKNSKKNNFLHKGKGANPAKEVFGEIEMVRFDPAELEVLWDLCQRLLALDQVRILFTTRKKLPKPYDQAFNHINLGCMDTSDAIELVQKTMTIDDQEPPEEDNQLAQPEIEALVNSVKRHAHSLVLLAPYISNLGVQQATETMDRVMDQLEQYYPDEREQALYASLELSMERISPQFRDRLTSLGIFHGGAHLYVMQQVLGLNEMERDRLISELFVSRLAHPTPFGFLHFHPDICPYLREQLTKAEWRRITPRWTAASQELVDYLLHQRFKEAHLAASITLLELPNLAVLLEYFRKQGSAKETLSLAVKLEQLIAQLGRPQLLAHFAAIRQELASKSPR